MRPLMTHSSPSRTAVVEMSRPVPLSGSVSPNVKMPPALEDRQPLSFCAARAPLLDEAPHPVLAVHEHPEGAMDAGDLLQDGEVVDEAHSLPAVLRRQGEPQEVVLGEELVGRRRELLGVLDLVGELLELGRSPRTMSR